MKRAMIAGSFDPITIGHWDLIERSAPLFEQLDVVIFDNGEKRHMFPAETRFLMVQDACRSIPNVTVSLSHALLADYVVENNIDLVIKGVRNSTDFDYEHQLSIINRTLCGVETVLLPARSELAYVSSTMVRDLILHGRDVSEFMPNQLKGKQYR